jgi:DNA-binding NarL/FixJ family response regulator
MSTRSADTSAATPRRAESVRVAIAEDSLLVRQGLHRILRDAGFDIVAEVATREQLLEAVERGAPEVALIDIRLPPGYGDEGLRAATEIRHRFPGVALLVLSQYIEAEYALRLLEGTERGVGYLLKDRILDTTQLSDAINRVLAGGVVVDPALVAQLLERPRRADPLEELTPREREVLNLMAEGLTDRGIAQRLYVTPKTVETHTRHIFQKLSLSENALENKRVHAVLTYLRA